MTLAKEAISTCCIYADGNDLEGTATAVRSHIETFVEPYGDRVRVVAPAGESFGQLTPVVSEGEFCVRIADDAEEK